MAKPIHKDIKVVRKELKYYIPYTEYISISALLRKVMKQDKHNVPGKGYLVRSLYFDTISNKSHEEKIAGLEERAKYRLRIYGLNDSSVKLEVKRKFNDVVVKETSLISREDAKLMQDKHYDFLLEYKDQLINKVYREFKKLPYMPVLLVDYHREAFISDFNGVRIVFDRFLKSSTTQLDLFKTSFSTSRLRKGIVIMEIKYNHFIPDMVKNMIHSNSFIRSAISKYTVGRIGDFEAVI